MLPLAPLALLLLAAVPSECKGWAATEQGEHATPRMGTHTAARATAHACAALPTQSPALAACAAGSSCCSSTCALRAVWTRRAQRMPAGPACAACSARAHWLSIALQGCAVRTLGDAELAAAGMTCYAVCRGTPAAAASCLRLHTLSNGLLPAVVCVCVCARLPAREICSGWQPKHVCRLPQRVLVRHCVHQASWDVTSSCSSAHVHPSSQAGILSTFSFQTLRPVGGTIAQV